MQKLINAIKKMWKGGTSPKVVALLWELDKADAYIEFMKEARIRGFEIEVAVIVDNQVCPSTIMARPHTKSGDTVLDFLQGAAIGERMRLWSELQELGYTGRDGP